ncbi:GNAT family N-acetyltransferase [bacterium]|nr:GNAT family N-acetyltransferase [bacterium]
MIPPLETDRLILRELIETDKQALHRILSDPVVMEFYPKVADWELTEFWYDKIRARYDKFGRSFYAVELKGEGDMIGICGLLDQLVEEEPFLEVGYLFAQAWWHKGYATEAARRCRDEGFLTHRVDHIISLIDPENKPSIHVAERNGMVYERTVAFKEVPNASVYGITRNHWLALDQSEKPGVEGAG